MKKTLNNYTKINMDDIYLGCNPKNLKKPFTIYNITYIRLTINDLQIYILTIYKITVKRLIYQSSTQLINLKMKTYNVNELLDRKKELETQVSETLNAINETELTYQKETHIEVATDRKKEFENKEKQDLNKFSIKFNGLVDELAKIKTAISKFNAENISELLYKRETARNTINYLTRIKTNLPKNKNVGRKVSRQDINNVALEVVDYEIIPMFELESVEKRLNETSAEERKLNTQIQKINLNAEIELE